MVLFFPISARSVHPNPVLSATTCASASVAHATQPATAVSATFPMAQTLPYVFIQCPCLDISAINLGNGSPGVPPDEERTFDPQAPRSNFGLYPLEHLLYCEECQQIRCPRCVVEEIVNFYCPACLFEVPSSNLRSDGNRCTRSCYHCPVCISPVQVAPTLATADPSLVGAENPHNTTVGGPFALFCQYCNWTSTEAGIELERTNGVFAQLAKMSPGGGAKISLKDVKERRRENPDDPPMPDHLVDRELQFASLKAFYQEQLADASAAPLGDAAAAVAASAAAATGFSSPSALSRIMSLYTGRSHTDRARRGPSDVVREALQSEEGLKLASLDDSVAIKKLMRGGWDATASRAQQMAQLEPAVRFQDELWPIPHLLRTKRSKRCPVCRHIISKPENKVTSTRFKIRLVAKSYIPTITIRPLNPAAVAVPVGSRPARDDEPPLAPFKPHQYILTFRNPIFDSIKVTLATPSTTPGRFASKVTILCPQFGVDANTDMWDDALREDGRETIVAGASRKPDEAGQSQQGEAGKIWERGRNWTSVVLEVIPASMRAPPDDDAGPLKEDEDILEIPMFVSIEWEVDAHNDMGTGLDRDKDSREKRELAYWCVLGVGRISLV